MKYPFISLFIFINMLLLLSGCEYRLKDDYYRELNTRDSANITIDLDTINSGFVLKGSTTYSFHSETNDLDLLSIRVFVDGGEIMNYSTKGGIFQLDGMNYSDGEHELEIVVTTHSGSGSLADLLGAEGFVLSRSWKFYVDNSMPVPVKITNIHNDNGVLKIEWERYTKYNFGKYEIVKVSDELGYGTKVSRSLGFITNPDQNYFYDYSYVGDSAKYQIRVFSFLGYAADGDFKLFADEKLSISTTIISGSKVRLSWNRCKYDKAFKNYRVSIYGVPDQILYNINTTSIEGDYGILGTAVQLALLVYSNESQFDIHTYSETSLTIGQPFMAFIKFYKCQGNNDILLTTYPDINRYNSSTWQIIATGHHANNFIDYIYSPDGDVLLRKAPQEKIDPLTLNVLANFDYLSLETVNLSSSSYGLVNQSPMKLFDFKNMKVIGELNINKGYKTSISEDNKYVFQIDNDDNSLKCYNIENGNATLIWKNMAQNFQLIPGSPDKILICNGALTEIHNVATNEITTSFPNESSEILDIDSDSKIVLFSGFTNYQSTLELYNYETGLKVQTIKHKGSPAFIKNGVIYCSDGWSISTVLK